MKRIFLRLKQPLRNERGEITFFACFFVVGIVMLISFLLLYASIRITCINIRNGAKMELGVTLFLLLFSIITFASTIITNIATKKREYAMFQSIGMTRKQTEKMALCESCVLAIGSLILTLILGIILGQILIKGLISAGIFYLSYTFPLTLFTVYCIVVVLIILTITISAFYSLQKTPLVERLRIVD